MRDLNDQVCGREDELVSFLYGELGERESRQFERHLHECGRCTTEFTAFGQIRTSILSWRDESLQFALAPQRAPIEATTTKPSALAAIREFFTLAPMWMKTATAFASLLFCVCAVLAFAYLEDRRPTRVIAQSDKIYSKSEADALVAQARQEIIDSQQTTKSSNTLATNDSSPKVSDKRKAISATTGYALNTRNLRKPLTRQERQELASDLGLVASRDEDDLDLGSDKINRAP